MSKYNLLDIHEGMGYKEYEDAKEADRLEAHPDKEMICRSVKKTGKMLIVDTSWPEYGVAAEMNRIINEYNPSILKAPTKSMGMVSTPCPTAKALEDMYYPDVHDISNTINKMVNGDNSVIDLPKKESMTDFYKHFKGPF